MFRIDMRKWLSLLYEPCHEIVHKSLLFVRQPDPLSAFRTSPAGCRVRVWRRIDILVFDTELPVFAGVADVRWFLRSVTGNRNVPLAYFRTYNAFTVLSLAMTCRLGSSAKAGLPALSDLRAIFTGVIRRLDMSPVLQHLMRHGRRMPAYLSCDLLKRFSAAQSGFNSYSVGQIHLTTSPIVHICSCSADSDRCLNRNICHCNSKPDLLSDFQLSKYRFSFSF